MTVVVLSDGAVLVSIEDVQENRPARPTGFDFLPDINGFLVAYEKVGGPHEVPIAGRVKSKAEAEVLESFIGRTLSLTERDGTISSDWSIKTDPAPVIKRKDGDSPDFSVDLRLWRLP